MEKDTTSLMLPYPPSTNTLFSTVGTGKKQRRIKSEAYQKWLADAQEAYLQQRHDIKPMTGKVSIFLMLKAPDKRKRDISNTIKAVEDFLVSHKIIESDDQFCVRSVMALWKDDLDVGCFVTIDRIEEWNI